MSVVRLVDIAGTTLSVVGLDCLDGTPLVDIKPYFASVDAVPEAIVGWSTAEKVERSTKNDAPSLQRR
jgi:tRNA (Thr-GGU) A37 N-methylase